jgi:purine-binding chemotaxis protein CheW
VAKRQLVVFKIGAEEFAIDILLTKEVVVLRDVTPIPETEDYVEGVMNLRGNLVPVIDLRKRLRASGTGVEDERRIIVVQLDRRSAGLIVDGASEVIRINETQVEPAPDIITELGVGYVLGVINLNGRFITLIDLNKALSGEIANELEEVMRALQSAAVVEVAPADAEQSKGPRRTPRTRQSR